MIAPEYPGYGIYKTKETNAETILEDAESVLTFLISHLALDLKKIMVAGRSIGSGPATFIATKFAFNSLILISPILSIRKAASERIGTLGSYLLRDRFDNEALIQDLLCPLLLLHGDEDSIVPLQHSLILFGNSCSPRKNKRKQID